MTDKEHTAERVALILSALVTAYLWANVSKHTYRQVVELADEVKAEAALA